MPCKYQSSYLAAKQLYRESYLQHIKEGVIFTCVLLLLLAFLFVGHTDPVPYDIDMLYGTLDLEAYELDDEPIYITTER